MGGFNLPLTSPLGTPVAGIYQFWNKPSGSNFIRMAGWNLTALSRQLAYITLSKN